MGLESFGGFGKIERTMKLTQAQRRILRQKIATWTDLLDNVLRKIEKETDQLVQEKGMVPILRLAGISGEPERAFEGIASTLNDGEFTPELYALEAHLNFLSTIQCVWEFPNGEVVARPLRDFAQENFEALKQEAINLLVDLLSPKV